MLLLRSLLYFIGSLIGAILIAAVGLVFFFLPINQRYKIISKWAVFCIWWLKVTLNIRLNVIGQQNIPKTACVIISNHQSTWETLGFQTIFPIQTWVLKQELLWIPFFGWGLALLKPVIINRGQKLKALKRILEQGKNRVEQGISVVIFPEGTRQPYQKLGSYQNGGAAMAKKANCDILPVYHNAGEFWPKGSFIKKPGVINVVIGKPISTNQQSATQITEQVRQWTQAQLISIRQ